MLERDLILSGVTLVTHDWVFTPEDVKANEMACSITGLVEYQEHGKFSPRRWHRELPHGRVRLRDGAVSYRK